uniref:Uncharacterized protein n=1 Tax=Romanomermis culicivorax TaxID=13658 RepID=A0A915I8P6_ROMCU
MHSHLPVFCQIAQGWFHSRFHCLEQTPCCQCLAVHAPLLAIEPMVINTAALMFNHKAMATKINMILTVTILTMAMTATTATITTTITVANPAPLCWISITNVTIDSPLILYRSFRLEEFNGCVTLQKKLSQFFYIYLYGVGLLFFAYCYSFLMQTNDWWSKFREFLCKWHCCCHRILRNQQSLPSPADDLQQNHLSVDQTAALVGRRNTLPMTCDSSRASQMFNASDLALTVNKYSPDNSKYPFLSAKRKVTHSAKNAGSFYLRLGAMIFGIVAMIDRSLQLFQAVDTGRVPHCYSISNVCEDVIAMMFIFVQLYFIFQNSKMTIHRFKEAGRFGTMHLIATNLCMWIRAVVVEEYHIIQEIRETLHHSNDEIYNATHVNVKSSSNSAISVSHAALNIIGGSSVYEDYSHCEYGDKELDHIIHYTKAFTTTCIIEYALICAGVSFIMWRNIGHTVRLRSKFRKQNFQIDCSSSTKGLFVGLLFVVFTLVTMVIFFTKIRLKQNIDALFIFYISDGLLYVTSIGALVFAAWKMRYLHYGSGNDRVVLLDDILLIVALIGQLMFCLFSMLALSSFTYVAILMVVVSLLRMIEVLIQTMFIFVAQRLIALTPSAQIRKPGSFIRAFPDGAERNRSSTAWNVQPENPLSVTKHKVHLQLPFPTERNGMQSTE